MSKRAAHTKPPDKLQYFSNYLYAGEGAFINNTVKNKYKDT